MTRQEDINSGFNSFAQDDEDIKSLRRFKERLIEYGLIRECLCNEESIALQTVHRMIDADIATIHRKQEEAVRLALFGNRFRAMTRFGV